MGNYHWTHTLGTFLRLAGHYNTPMWLSTLKNYSNCNKNNLINDINVK